MPRQRQRTAHALLMLLAASCREPEPDGPADAGSEDGSSESETGGPIAAGDACDDSLSLDAPTTLTATLRHASAATLGQGCGATGPVVFARVRLASRVDLTLGARGRGFTPTLGVQLPGCVSALDDPDRLLACADALPVTLFDVGPESELLVTVGVAADDPVLERTIPEDAGDPLDFELDLDVRPVLGEGQRCSPDLGRCEAGTVCLPADEDGVVVERCRRPPADSCVAPGELVLAGPGEPVELTIPPEEPHSDAHTHACTGWRRPERVERLVLPATLPPEATLELHADDPRVGLALRSPSCAPEHALACAPANASVDGTTLSWGGVGELGAIAESGAPLLLFIELPRSDLGTDPPGTITVEIEIASN